MSMRRKTSQFIATDENGRRYTILIFTNVIKAGTLENPSMEEVEGMEELKTFEGMALNRLEKGKYQIAQTGIIVQMLLSAIKVKSFHALLGAQDLSNIAF